MPELVNTGNVHATAVGGDIRLDAVIAALGPELVADTAFIEGLITSLIGPVESNANGSFVRLANGLQVAWYQSDTPTPTNTQTVAPYWNSFFVTLTFPTSFVATPVIVPSGRSGPSNFALSVVVVAVSTTGCSLRGYGVNDQQEFVPGYIAIGRWK